MDIARIGKIAFSVIKLGEDRKFKYLKSEILFVENRVLVRSVFDPNFTKVARADF